MFIVFLFVSSFHSSEMANWKHLIRNEKKNSFSLSLSLPIESIWISNENIVFRYRQHGNADHERNKPCARFKLPISIRF